MSRVSKVSCLGVIGVLTFRRWPDFPRIKEPQPIEDKEPEVTAPVKEIFQKARNGAFDRELYTSHVADLMAQYLAPGGETVRELSSYGELKDIALVGKTTQNGSREYRYLLTYENTPVLAHCVYDPQGKFPVCISRHSSDDSAAARVFWNF